MGQPARVAEIINTDLDFIHLYRRLHNWIWDGRGATPDHGEPSDSLSRVHRAKAAEAQASQDLQSAVVQARRSGASWEQLGAALGLSKEAAHEQYGWWFGEDPLGRLDQ